VPGYYSGNLSTPEDDMFAIVAAIIFGIALLIDLLNVQMGDEITMTTLTLAGLLFLALQWAVGGRFAGRRPGRG
jgi:hypothetical protein